MLISIETHISCDFPGGSGSPIPPLDPHLRRARMSDGGFFPHVAGLAIILSRAN